MTATPIVYPTSLITSGTLVVGAGGWSDVNTRDKTMCTLSVRAGTLRTDEQQPHWPAGVLARPAPRRPAAAVDRGHRVRRHRLGAAVPGGLPPRGSGLRPQRR